MIRDLFYSLGRMARWGIVAGALLATIALMMLGAKVGGWFTDAQQVLRASQLDEREAQLKADERAAQDKREADIKRREEALAGAAAKQALQLSDAKEELARVKAETAKANEARKAADAAAAKAAARKAAAEAAEPFPVVVAPVRLTLDFHDGKAPVPQVSTYATLEECRAAAARIYTTAVNEHAKRGSGVVAPTGSCA